MPCKQRAFLFAADPLGKRGKTLVNLKGTTIGLREIACIPGLKLREIPRPRGRGGLKHSIFNAVFLGPLRAPIGSKRRCVVPRVMVLSPDLTLVYVLHRGGLVGRVSSGRVARDDSGSLLVYDRYGRIVEYLSAPAENIRSWCVLGPAGTPVNGWHDIKNEDLSTILRS